MKNIKVLTTLIMLLIVSTSCNKLKTDTYEVEISQQGADAPTVTIIKDQLKTVTEWKRTNKGNYYIVGHGAFKGTPLFTIDQPTDTNYTIDGAFKSDAVFKLYTYNNGKPIDDVLDNINLRIIVLRD